jgi:sn-glycerol 3-phosphate transport system substrate-binding protein
VPALAQMYDLATQLMVDLKVVEPMQSFIDKDKFDLSTYEPNVLGYYSVGGKLYGMPFNTSAPILYYNKDLFKAAGLDPNKPPRTYAEVLDYAKKLTKKDASGKMLVAGYGISIYGWIFEQLNAAAGGLYLNNGNGRDARATAAAFNSPEGIAAVQFWKDGVDAGVYQNFGQHSAGTDAVVAAFSSQQVAMFIESTARVRALIDASTGKFELGTAYIPRPNEDAYKKAGVIIGGASVYIMRDRPTAEQNCAWEFVKFSTSPEIQAFWHTASGYYPVTKKAYDIQLDKDWVTKYPQFLTAVNQLHDSPAIMSSMGGFSGTMQQNRARIQQAIEEVLTGKATAKDALDKAAADVAKFLSDYNKTVQ